MHKKLTAIAIALAAGVLGYAQGASALYRWTLNDAETCAGIPRSCLTANNPNPVWGDDAGEDEIILENPLFVVNGGKLTILPGVTVRGNPRNGAVVAGATAQTPATIIVTQSGQIDAQGENTPSGVIIMTTAAIDNNGDLQPDDFDGNSFRDPYPGYNPALSGAPAGTLPCTCGNNGTAGDPTDDCIGSDGLLGTGDDSLGNCVVDTTPTFHDDSPRVAPLAPLTPPISPDPGLGPDGINGTSDDTGGDGNVQLWGGIIVNGKAPTNTIGATTSAVSDNGFGIVEGLTVPGFPEAWAIYGGVMPHDSSGILRYISIRHTGDELGVSNELNGLTLAGVGDGTIVDHIDVYSVFDDCFEWFGGTVNSHHLMCSHAGDDGFDTDEGHTGVTQFGVYIAPNYNELDCTAAACPITVGTNPDGGNFGTEGGDQVAEGDGEDCTLAPANCNKSGPDGPTAGTDLAPWPMQSFFQYNLTAVGNGEGDDVGAGAVDYQGNSQCTGVGTPFICCTGAGAGFCENSSNSGWELRNGFAGELRNSIITNTGTGTGVVLTAGAGDWSATALACRDYDAIAGPNGDTDNGDPSRVVATTLAVGAEVSGSWPQPNVAFTAGAPTVAGGGFGPPAAGVCAATISQLLENGDVLTGSGPGAGNLVNFAGFAGLNKSDTTFRPYGNAAGHLVPALKTSASDLRPVGGLGAIGVVSPGGNPVNDPNATYRGAFEAGGEVWTDGWTALSIGGLN